MRKYERERKGIRKSFRVPKVNWVTSPDKITIVKEVRASADAARYNELYDSNAKHIQRLYRKYRDAILHGDKRQSQLRTGDSINIGDLIRNVIDSTGGNEAQNDFFERIIPADTRDQISIAILVDESGSMGGKRQRAARDTCIILGTVLEKLGIHDYGIWGFVTGKYPSGAYSRASPLYERYLELCVYKDFDEKWQVSKGRMPNIRASGDTPTAPAILHAAGKLAERKKRVKLLIVITDGEPASWIHPYLAANVYQLPMLTSEINVTKFSIDAARRTGIEVVGIGIHDPELVKIYPGAANFVPNMIDLFGAKNAVINEDLSQLLDDTLSVIDKRLQRLGVAGI